MSAAAAVQVGFHTMPGVEGTARTGRQGLRTITWFRRALLSKVAIWDIIGNYVERCKEIEFTDVGVLH